MRTFLFALIAVGALAALTAPAAGASPLSTLTIQPPVSADVVVSFGFGDCAPAPVRRRVVRRTTTCAPTVRTYATYPRYRRSYSYGYTYPRSYGYRVYPRFGYSYPHAYRSYRAPYYGPRIGIGLGFGYSRHYGHHRGSHGRTVRVAGRRR